MKKYLLPVSICSLELAAHVASFIEVLKPFESIIGMADAVVILGYFYFMVEDTKSKPVRN